MVLYLEVPHLNLAIAKVLKAAQPSKEQGRYSIIRTYPLYVLLGKKSLIFNYRTIPKHFFFYLHIVEKIGLTFISTVRYLTLTQSFKCKSTFFLIQEICNCQLFFWNIRQLLFLSLSVLIFIPLKSYNVSCPYHI